MSGSGSSSIKIYSTTDSDFPLTQTLEKAHGLGCHHLATSRNGQVAASVGFGGEVKLWNFQGGQWVEQMNLVGAVSFYPRLAASKLFAVIIECQMAKKQVMYGP